jgi:hypothetical protein
MFASSSSSSFSNKLRIESMDSSHSTDTVNLTNANNIKFTTLTTIDDDENIWDKIKVTKNFVLMRDFQFNILVIFQSSKFNDNISYYLHNFFLNYIMSCIYYNSIIKKETFISKSNKININK